MFSNITSYLYKNQDEEIDRAKCSQISEALYQARIEAAAAKAIQSDQSTPIEQVLVTDLRNLIDRLSKSAQSVSESQDDQQLWKELPLYVKLLENHPPGARLSDLPVQDAIRVTHAVSKAAGRVKERTNARQVDLLNSLDHITRGKFKATTVVGAESRRSTRLHTLLLANLNFDQSARDALSRTLRTHQLVVVDLSNCFLGDHDTITFLTRDLCNLTQLSVLSLKGNALTNEIIPYLISDKNDEFLFGSSATNNNNNNNVKNKRHIDDDQTSNSNSSNDDDDDVHDRVDVNPKRSSYSSNNLTALLESQDKFLCLRVLTLDDNEISVANLQRVKATLAKRWLHFVQKYDNNSNSNVMSHGHHHDATTTFFRPTTTQLNFRNPAPSCFLSLDGQGMAGILQAKYLMLHPEFSSSSETGGGSSSVQGAPIRGVVSTPSSSSSIECIVGTSSSVITACALALGNIPLASVLTTFKRLEAEVFERSEVEAQHYAESAGMWLRSWWTGGDYYSSSRALQILKSLFGTTKFSEFPRSRVIAVLDSADHGQVLYASSHPASQSLWNQCHWFSAEDPNCPTVAEVCLAAMAAPGFFAPKKLPMNLLKGNSNRTSSSMNNNNHNVFSTSATSQQPQQQNEVKYLTVFDACGAMPNPSHIALIESMRPTQKPRRLISIACENEEQISSLPANGVSSMASAALSTWPSARVAGETDVSVRQHEFAKLLKAHSYISRAVSISVEHTVQSTRENEKCLEQLVEERRNQRKEQRISSMSAGGAVASSETNKEEEKQDNHDGEDNNNNNAQHEENDEHEQPQQQQKQSVDRGNDSDEEEDNQGEEMKSIRNLHQDQPNNNKSATQKLAESSKFSNLHQQQQSTTSSATSLLLSSSVLNSTSTAISYERIFPCTKEAPHIDFDEKSMRILTTALDKNIPKP